MTDVSHKVLGLDLASNTGFALLIDKDLKESGTVSFPGELPKRLYDFEKWLASYLKENNPDLIVYEIPHFRGYAATMSGVGLSSITLKVGYSFGTPVTGVRTTTLKSFATTNGKATKEEMTAKANELFNLTLEVKENNDEADAIHLANFGVIKWDEIIKQKKKSKKK